MASREVIFLYTEDETGTFIYPDEPEFFNNERVLVLDGVKNVIAKYRGANDSIPDYSPPEIPDQPYTKQDFMDDQQAIADKLFK